jgi:ketosteroid isomerase-like protein
MSRSIAFPPFSPFALEGKATLRQAAETNFANADSVTFSPINPQCRVIGSTGIVWGHTALTIKPKDGPLNTTFARFTFIFAKTTLSGARWRCTFPNFRRVTDITTPLQTLGRWGPAGDNRQRAVHVGHLYGCESARLTRLALRFSRPFDTSRQRFGVWGIAKGGWSTRRRPITPKGWPRSATECLCRT